MNAAIANSSRKIVSGREKNTLKSSPEAVSARRAWVSISGPRITPRITGAIGKS